ncbi:hypothetical protein JCM8097_002997 [Rhodosporidiobolus ruineniae]
MSTPPASRLIILGATGETGRQALTAALKSPAVSHVYSFGRTAPSVDTSLPTSKLTHASLDFEALLREGKDGVEAQKLKDVNADAVVIGLAMLMKNAKGDWAKWERVDRDYVVAAAEAARVEGKEGQRVIYVSAAAANSKAWYLYGKSKGQTEEALAGLGYSEAILFRPVYLAIPGGRPNARKSEVAFGYFTNFFSSFTNALQVPTPIIGRALVAAATAPLAELKQPRHGYATELAGKPAWVVGNAASLMLGGATDPRIDRV